MLKELIQGARRNPIWFSSIAAITAVQGWLGWEFWGAVTDRPAEQAALRAIGLAFVGSEVVALDMASRAALQDEKARAATLRAIWVSLALLNFAVDVNALSRVLRTQEETRLGQVAAYEALQTESRRLEARIGSAEAGFDDTLLPIAAYDQAIASKKQEIALAARAAGWRKRQLERERGELETARAVAVQVAEWRRELATIEAQSLKSRPIGEGAGAFKPLGDALSGAMQAAGVEHAVTPEEARDGIVVAAALAMKILLTLGVWAGLERVARPAEVPTRARPREGQVVPFPKRPGVRRFGRQGRVP